MATEATFTGRTDSLTAGNDAINLIKADNAPAITFTFLAEDSAGLDGNRDGNLTFEATGVADIDTVVRIGTTEYNFIYQFTGTLPTTQPNGAGKVPDQFEGEQIIVIEVIGYPTSGDTTRLMFLPNGYPAGDPNEGDMISLADMNLFDQGNMSIQAVNIVDPEPLCFLAGTLIETPRGPVAVEDLTDGDLVMTAHNGAQPLAWVTSTRHVWPGSDDKHKPVMVKQGAFGGGVPTKDLIVSPQHHFVLEGQIAFEMFAERAVLAPAKGLTGLAGIRTMKGRKQAVYYHVMLPVHDVLIAHGVKAESFYPGPTAIKMMSREQRDALLAIVPALRDDPENGYGPTAHKKITRRQAEAYVKALQSSDSATNVAPKLALAS